MNALEARTKVMNNSDQISQLNEIYNKINKAVNLNFHNIFISDFDISISDKNALEDDDYLVDTRYKTGFQVRWFESNIEYFKRLIESNKRLAKLKIKDEVIEKYARMQGFLL
jgi:hypothetical protein